MNKQVSYYIVTTYNMLTEQTKVYYAQKYKKSARKLHVWENGHYHQFELDLFQFSVIEKREWEPFNDPQY